MGTADSDARRILAGGILALAVALGISRFAYTPLLPLMQQAVAFGDDVAGYLASANYAGYLIGALWAARTPRRERRLSRLRGNLLVSLGATVAMGLTTDLGWWIVLRGVSGASGAMVFVLASGLVLEALGQRGRQGWSGWLYAGVGVGIVLCALLVPLLDALGGWRWGWLGLGFLACIMTLGPWHWLGKCSTVVTAAPQQQGDSSESRQGMLFWLIVAYGCEGLGYIVTGTFLVSQLQRTPHLAETGYLAWLLVGATAVPSCVLWMRLGLRLGLAQALIAAHLLQAIGIVLPLVMPNLAGALGGAILFGGTFLGIAALSLVLGRSLAPDRADWAIALLTTAFGTGQVLGAGIAGELAAGHQGFALPLAGAAAVVVLGSALLGAGLVHGRIPAAGMKTGQPSYGKE